MALVAYSDDSDFGSDSEEADQQANGVANDLKTEIIPEVIPKKCVQQSTPNSIPAVQEHTVKKSATLPNSDSSSAVQDSKITSGVDDIVDEDDFEDVHRGGPSSLLASIPAAIPVTSMHSEVAEVEDELNDVPTVDTWKITAELQKNNDKFKTCAADSASDKATFERPKKKAKSKVKFFVPALSEVRIAQVLVS